MSATPSEGPDAPAEPAASRGPPQPYRPRPWRVLLAFLIAPYAASLMMVLPFSFIPNGGIRLIASGVENAVGDALFIALVGAYPIAFLFGVPLFVLLYGRVGFGPIPPIIAGFVIVAAGVTALQALDHHVDWDGYVSSAETALLGAFGGLVFWMVAVWRDPRRRP